jgi:hypothetical protein
VLFGAAHNGALGKIAGLLAIGLMGAMIVAPHANGQAALDQYKQPTVPGGTAGAVGGGGSQNADGTNGAGIGAVAGETGSGSGGGSLPFTGYPVTAIVLIALALLCAGVLVRWATQAVRRIRA